MFTIGTPDGSDEKFAIRVPKLLSFLATGTLRAAGSRASTTCRRSTRELAFRTRVR
jgi:hypothetical protein